MQISTYMHAHMCLRIYILTPTHAYIHTYIYTYIHTYTYTYIHTYIHATLMHRRPISVQSMDMSPYVCPHNSLQHTATHCNTLQQAPDFGTVNGAQDMSPYECLHNSLQLTATDCNTLQHTATHYNRHPISVQSMEPRTWIIAPAPRRSAGGCQE